MYSSKRFFLILWFLVLVFSGLQWTTPARAGDPDFIALSIGGYDVNDDEGAIELRLEYRSNRRLWVFKPFSGMMINSETAVYGYGGVMLDMFFDKRFVATPSIAVGLYHNGAGKDLGYPVEFRSQLEFSYRLDDRARFSLGFSHISNAGLDDINPGTEELVITYAIPFSEFVSN